MTQTQNNFPRSGSLVRPAGGVKPGAAAALSGVCAVAPASSPAPKPGKLILKGQTITKIPARPARVKRVPVAMPPRIVAALLVLPAVLNEIEFNARLTIVKASGALLAHGVTLNKAARALGVAPSQLSVWRKRYTQDGAEALRPAHWKAGRKPKSGRARRHSAFIELLTARR